MAERNWGCRVSIDYIYKGWRLAVLENELLRVSLLLDKGGDIVEFSHKPSGIDYMWWTPWGLHERAKMIPSSSMSEGHFGDYYQGGWQEIFPSGGVPNVHRQTEFGLHGEASLLPWRPRILKDTPQRVTLELSTETYRTPFKAVKTLTLEKGKASLFIESSLSNQGEVDLEAMWGQHPAFGAPFLNPNCRIDLPGADCEMQGDGLGLARFSKGTHGPWPRLKGKDGRMIDLSRFPDPKQRSNDMFYLKNLKGNWYAITDTQRKQGFSLAWDLKAYPYLWFWQVYKGGLGNPFWGRTYNCALEPFSSIPSGLAQAVARGTALKFKAGQTRKAWLTATAYSGLTKVKKVTRQGLVA